MISRKQEIMDVVGQFLTGLKLVNMLAGLLDRSCSLKMALHANRIALLGRQRRGIDNRSLSFTMALPRAMTALASDPPVQEWLSGVLVLCSGHRCLHPTGVTVQA